MQHQHPQHPQQGFLTLYDTNAPLPPHMRAPSNTNSKNHLTTSMASISSIWAPQPQAGDATWPRALEAFAQPTREDVFGPTQHRNVGAGAIGDGRSSKPGSGSGSPDLHADSHVEQLLRTLNLNSPEPQPEVAFDLDAGAVSRSSPTSTSTSSSAGTGTGSRSSGRTKPAPPPLDLSFATSSNSISASMHSTSSGSISASANTSSNTSSQLTDESGSVPSLTSRSSASASYPQSPGSDYSPLSLSSALLTPLDSPSALSSPQSYSQGLHSPSSHGHLSSLHGSPLHSPGLSLSGFYSKDRAQQQYSVQAYDYLLDSPGRAPRTLGLPLGLSSPASPQHQQLPPLRSAPGSGSSRFLPLPPTPPSTLSALPPHLGVHGSPLGLGMGGSALFADGPGVLPSTGNNATNDGAHYRLPSAANPNVNLNSLGGDWLRPDDSLGLGLGLGFVQPSQQPQQQTPMPGATLYRTGAGAGGAFGAGAFAEEQQQQLRGGFVYEPQQVQQLQQLQQQPVQRPQPQLQHIQQQEPLTFGAGFTGKGWELDAGSLGATGGVAAGGSAHVGSGTGGTAAGATSGGGTTGREGRGNNGNEPINFLSLLHPASSPPYASFVSRIIKSADQQASIFLQQKLKVAGPEERARIVDAICARGGEMMMHRFGNWAVQRCLEAATGPEERRKIVACMRGRVVDLATNCYGCHVLQKALDCEEEEVRLLIVSELLMGDPAQTLVNKHASHVWSKIMELSWTPPAPPIFAYVNKSLKGKWAALACHETGSLVVQHAFENLEESAKDGIVEELLGQGSAVFAEVAKNQWGAYCVQHILEHGSDKHRQMALEHLLNGLLEFATNEQGSKSVVKALKEGGKETLDRVVQRMCEPAKGARRAIIVDLALSLTGSQLIASVLPNADKDQRAMLYDCIRGHIVTLRGCKTGSKVIWLFDRMRAYYGY